MVVFLVPSTARSKKVFCTASRLGVGLQDRRSAPPFVGADVDEESDNEQDDWKDGDSDQ